MSSPASLKNHPIHPMLIPLPIGLLLFSLVSDIIYAAEWGGPIWTDMAYYTMLGGIIGSLMAAVPGFIDYLSITDAKTKITGTKHMIANLTVVALYVVNFVIRSNAPTSAGLPIGLSVLGVGLLVYSGWLGGDMVYEHGMAVDLDADARLKKGRPKPYEEKGRPQERAEHVVAPRTR